VSAVSSTETEHLRHGWEPDTPSSDTVLLAGVRAMMDRAEWWARAMGGRVQRNGVLVLTDTGTDVALLNQAISAAPLDRSVAELARVFYPRARPFVLASPAGGADPGEYGLVLMGHPPFMVRAPGGAMPDAHSDITVTEVADAGGLATWSAVLSTGFALGAVSLPAAVLDGASRFWLASWRGEPGAVAASHVAHGVVDVEAVATLPALRGRGLGEAVSWAATLADPSLPAVLLASDPGRPVYQRMGYLPMLRWTMWYRS
jgi:GNAT superfamily N-acetyltransferase